METSEELITELRQCGVALLKIADALQGAKDMESAAPESTPPAKEEKKLTFEDVRAVAADKSRQGFTRDVKALLTKYGAGKLSDVDAGQYPVFFEELEAIGHAD